MSLRMSAGPAVIVRRLERRDIDGVVALVQARIEADKAEGREPRLGPLSPSHLLASFPEFGPLCTVLENAASGELLGCALVTAFEALDDEEVAPPSGDAEAAKLTLDEPLLGTKAASILHAVRLANVVLADVFDLKPPILYYNVLSGNRGQLKHIEALGLDRVRPKGRLARILDQRKRKIDLKGQDILTFTPGEPSKRKALAYVIQAAAERALVRVDWDAAQPTIEGWELRLEHPVFDEQLPIMIAHAKALNVPVPKSLEARLTK